MDHYRDSASEILPQHLQSLYPSSQSQPPGQQQQQQQQQHHHHQQQQQQQQQHQQQQQQQQQHQRQQQQQQQQQGFMSGSQHERDLFFQQTAKNVTQSQPGANVLASYNPQGISGQGNMGGPGGPGGMGGPGMNGPGGPGGMGGPGAGGPMMGGGMGGPGGPGMGMSGAPGMNGPAGQRAAMMQRRPMPMQMGMQNPAMVARPAGMQQRMQNGMGPGGMGGPGGMLGGQGGMSNLPGQGGLPLGGPGSMGGMSLGPGGMPSMNGGPGGMQSMAGGPGGMSMGGGAGMGGMSGIGSQGGMPGLPTQGLSQGSMNSMGGGMSSSMAGGAGGMPNLAGGGGIGAQPGGMNSLGGQGSLGGPSNMGPGAGGPGGMMPLNGMSGSGAPGMPGANGISNANGMPGPNGRQWSLGGQYQEDMKRPPSTQLDEFATLTGAAPHGVGGPLPGGPPHGIGGLQHGPQHGPPGVGGPQHGVGGMQHGGPGQHGVGGPGQHGGQHGMNQQHGPGQPPPGPPPGQHAGSPGNGMQAHPQHHHVGGGTPVPGHMGTPGPGHMVPGAPPAHMSQAGTPRMGPGAPTHPGGPSHMTNAPSPHHMLSSPANHPGHPHQTHHLAGSPAHQMSSSPRHIMSSSPAPGQGPQPPRSGAPTPVPPRGASADPMMRMGSLGPMRGPEDQIRPPNDMMAMRTRDGMMPPMEGISRAPSVDDMSRPGMQGGMPLGANGPMRTGEIGRLGPDGTIVRGPGPMYGQPPPYGAPGGAFGQPAPPQYVLHQTPAQQHQNMQIQRNVPRGGSVDDLPVIPAHMNIQDELNDMASMSSSGRRLSMPPQMTGMNGVGPVPRPGPGPGPGPGVGMGPRQSMLTQQRPCALGIGVARMLQMSSEMMQMGGKPIQDWVAFRNNYFTRDARITLAIFHGVEGRTYVVRPEIIARFFLTTYECGVLKMSLGLNGASESEDPASNLESTVETTTGVWRCELANGWIVEQNGPLKFMLAAQQLNDGQFQLKIREMTFTAPTTSYLFKMDDVKGTQVAGPMTPRISPGLPARKTENGSLGDQFGEGREEEGLSFEKVTFPPKPFQKFGFAEGVWRLLAMSGCVDEMATIMDFSHFSQTGPLNALDRFAEMVQDSRTEVGLDPMNSDLGGQFPQFADFPPTLTNNSPAPAHAHPGMHPHSGVSTVGRQTPIMPPLGHPRQLAGHNDLPPLPPLEVGRTALMHQSPSLTHPMAQGQQANGQASMKRKLQGPEQGTEGSGPSASGAPHRGNNKVKQSPATTRKKAKPNPLSTG